MNVDSILRFQAKNPEEDFYAVLGCDPSASVEQVTAEFKARVKDCHPDKNSADPQSQQTFQILLRVHIQCVPISFEWKSQKVRQIERRSAGRS